MYYKVTTYPHKIIRHALATPFILGMIIPLVPFDLCLEIYHQFSFRLYNIPVNRRSDYIRIDRHKLSYLNLNDKIWCTYCGYANGLMAYGVKIAGDTEKYWCAVKHKEADGYVPESHHSEFLPYDDENAYQKFIAKK